MSDVQIGDSVKWRSRAGTSEKVGTLEAIVRGGKGSAARAQKALDKAAKAKTKNGSRVESSVSEDFPSSRYVVRVKNGERGKDTIHLPRYVSPVSES